MPYMLGCPNPCTTVLGNTKAGIVGKAAAYKCLAANTAGAGLAGKGACLGLSLGVLGPVVLAGAVVVGGYFIWKANVAR
ncbi:hypothetical protein ACFL6Y_07460 [Elusimicrobiota bacterium]